MLEHQKYIYYAAVRKHLFAQKQRRAKQRGPSTDKLFEIISRVTLVIRIRSGSGNKTGATSLNNFYHLISLSFFTGISMDYISSDNLNEDIHITWHKSTLRFYYRKA